MEMVCNIALNAVVMRAFSHCTLALPLTQALANYLQVNFKHKENFFLFIIFFKQNMLI